MRKVLSAGVFTHSSRDIINENFQQLGIGTVGDVLYVDPVNGNNGSAAKNDSTRPYKTLLAAYTAANSGKHDVIVLVSNAQTTATARVDAAFTWAKDALHLIGLCPPAIRSQRARIAPTSTTTAFAAFFTISGDGCLFKNIQWWHGFATGTAAMIAVTVSGERNVFINCHFAGMGDDASAQDAGSRCLKISGGGENEFINCALGVGTVARTAANAIVELAGGTARNRFVGCEFDAWTTTAQTQLDFIVSAAAAIDRWQLVDRCIFFNAMNSTGYLIQTASASIAAGQNGKILYKDCTLMGRTGFGKDAPTRTFLLIDGAAPTNSTSGLPVAPSA